MIFKLIKKMFNLLPDNDIKKKIRYKYNNICNVNDFKIYPRKNGYEIAIYDMTFFFENDPFFEFCTSIPGYFWEYKLKKGDVLLMLVHI